MEATTRRLDADLPTAAEVGALMKASSPRAATGVRNRAMIAVAYRSGLRVGEILDLKLKDLDLDGGITVTHGKGDRHRVVGIDVGTAAVIEQWLKVRRRRAIAPSSPVFCTLAGRPIDSSYVRHMLPRLARRAGIQKRIHAHSFRYVYAVELEQEGFRLSEIRDLLGHSSASVTDAYLRRLGASEAVKSARRREWPTDF
jgi:site-specific recombinase XerD